MPVHFRVVPRSDVVRAVVSARVVPRSACAAHARMALAERLATTRRAFRAAVLLRVLHEWRRMGGAERSAARRIAASLDEYDVEWQCELLVQEAALAAPDAGAPDAETGPGGPDPPFFEGRRGSRQGLA